MGKVLGRNAKILRQSNESPVTIVDIAGALKVATISTATIHKLTVGDYVLIAGVDEPVQANGYWKVDEVVDSDTFKVTVSNNLEPYTFGGTVQELNIKPAFELTFEDMSDEVDVTEFQDSDYREFMSGMMGGNVSFSYYLNDNEVPISSGASVVLHFLFGKLAVVTEIVTSKRDISTPIDGAVKVTLSGRTTDEVQESII